MLPTPLVLAKQFGRRAIRAALISTSVAAFFYGLPAAAAEASIEPDAVTVLKQMSDFLGGQGGFSVSYETDTEIVTADAQKLAFVASGTLEFVRPNKLYATRQGLIANAELFFNGAALTIFGKNLNAYFSKDLAGSVEDAIDVLRSDVGLDMPGADLLRGDISGYLTANVVSGTHVGETMLGGFRVHHLAFRTQDVDWQIWIRADGEPLPVRYTIVSKWVAQAPAYSVTLRDWKLGPQADAARFDFTPPEGAQKVDTIDTDHLGAIASPAE